jgi:hypothetical protein
MRIIANENVGTTVIQGLRSRGHDVVSVKECMQSAPDTRLLLRLSASPDRSAWRSGRFLMRRQAMTPRP